MPALGDLQGRVRAALLTGDASVLAPVLVGGRSAAKRFAIHQRHYLSSLVQALLARFPATVWLVGSELVTAAAQAFVRERPPRRPCIAEYGEDFPRFLAARPGAADLPYLGDFTTLEWHVGRVSLAAERTPLGIQHLAGIGPLALQDSEVTMQPGLQYLHLHWAVDELLSAYLSGNPPDRFELTAGEVWLELRGNRGDLTMRQLTRSGFAFRRAASNGATIGEAAAGAFDFDEQFDAGQALIALAAEGLIAGIHTAARAT